MFVVTVSRWNVRSENIHKNSTWYSLLLSLRFQHFKHILQNPKTQKMKMKELVQFLSRNLQLHSPKPVTHQLTNIKLVPLFLHYKEMEVTSKCKILKKCFLYLVLKYLWSLKFSREEWDYCFNFQTIGPLGRCFL